jgi:hypothetical protein
MLGVKVPTSMDGRIIYDIFTDEFREKHNAQYQDGIPSTQEHNRDELTENEQAALADMLRSLGYVN